MKVTVYQNNSPYTRWDFEDAGGWEILPGGALHVKGNPRLYVNSEGKETDIVFSPRHYVFVEITDHKKLAK
jgi:outer membrane protein assembly factor BamB